MTQTVCYNCGTGERVFVLLQRRLGDESDVLDVIGVYRTAEGAENARAATWADEYLQEVYGGEERDHFRIEAITLQD